jgi:hypothetical protein
VGVFYVCIKTDMSHVSLNLYEMTHFSDPWYLYKHFLCVMCNWIMQ